MNLEKAHLVRMQILEERRHETVALNGKVVVEPLGLFQALVFAICGVSTSSLHLSLEQGESKNAPGSPYRWRASQYYCLSKTAAREVVHLMTLLGVDASLVVLPGYCRRWELLKSLNERRLSRSLNHHVIA